MSDNIDIEIEDNGNFPDPVIKWPGGRGTFQVTGTFNSATAKLQARLGKGANDWTDVGEAAIFTEPALAGFILGKCDLRINVAGGSSPDIKASIAGSTQDGLARR